MGEDMATAHITKSCLGAGEHACSVWHRWMITVDQEKLEGKQAEQ